MIAILVITIIATIAAFTGAYILRKKNNARRKLLEQSNGKIISRI